MSPFLVVLSAPSGAGKSTIARRIVEQRNDLAFSVSATTRSPRGEERDGVHYHFLDRAEFERRAGNHEFLEWAAYGGNLYGTLKEEVDNILRSGRHVLLDIEVVGARQVRGHTTNLVGIFVLPPSGEVLVNRLEGRKSEGRAELAQRIRRSVEEIEEAVDYDYIVVNDDLDRAVTEVQAILDAEIRRPMRIEGIEGFMNGLRDTLVSLAAGLEADEE